VPDLSVAAFLASELRRAEFIRGANSMLEHVTLDSWVLFRLGSGKIRFEKVIVKSTPTSNPVEESAAAVGQCGRRVNA
jgi:hypothetical protein